MANRSRRRKCRCCHQLYDPDPRSRHHQAYCAQPQCRKASKAASQRRWLESDKGRDYFRGPANLHRVRAWRLEHPGYARKQPKPPGALQEDCPPQTVAPHEVKPSLSQDALQEMIITQGLLLTGFIAHYTGSALQENIDPTLHRLIRLGQQIQGPSTPLRVDPSTLLRVDPSVLLRVPSPLFGAGLVTGGQRHGGFQACAPQGSVTTGPPSVQLDRP